MVWVMAIRDPGQMWPKFPDIRLVTISVLPKDACFTANSRIKVTVLLGMNMCGSFPFFPHPTLSLASDQTLKDLEVELITVDLANCALQPSPKFTTEVKYQFHRGY